MDFLTAFRSGTLWENRFKSVIVETRVFDPSQASPEMAASYAQQVKLKEFAEGGTGDVARSVLGYALL